MKKIWPVVFISFLLIQSSYAEEVVYYYENDPYAQQAEDNSIVEYYYDEDQDTQRTEPVAVSHHARRVPTESIAEQDYSDSVSHSRLASHIQTNEKVIIVNPRRHVWGAYSREGMLLHSGIATSGSTWCADLGRSCRTKVGTFRINSLGARNCKSSRYPLGRGGALMPYCMYFNGNQGIHGSYEVSEANRSHGCVRVTVKDAEWLRFNFASIGTKVIIMNY